MTTVRLTRDQVREVDRIAIERYGIPGIVLMENAARAVVDVAMEMLEGRSDPNVLIFCGGGNNGGDGLAAARHLHNRGAFVEIAWVTRPDQLKGDAGINLRIIQAMGLPSIPVEDADDRLAGGGVDLIVDAVFGTGLQSPPREPQWLELMNQFSVPVLAVDLPSGLDCDTGQPLGACVRATRTVTFVAEKAGFANPRALQFTGPITTGDIGCPRELIDEVRQTRV